MDWLYGLPLQTRVATFVAGVAGLFVVWRYTMTLAAQARLRRAELRVNRRSGIYHRRTCEWSPGWGGQSAVGFTNCAEAERGGFRPCRVCHPRQAQNRVGWQATGNR